MYPLVTFMLGNICLISEFDMNMHGVGTSPSGDSLGKNSTRPRPGMHTRGLHSTGIIMECFLTVRDMFSKKWVYIGKKCDTHLIQKP